jgi:hypothetical protein
MKAEIEKILESVLGIHAVNGANGGYKTCGCLGCKETRRTMPIATSSLTSLIIKWLEGKREQGIKFHSGRQNSELSAYSPTDNQKVGRNQLITELIGEVRNGNKEML